MPSRARMLTARPRRFDPARVDALVASLLLIEMELQLWLNAQLHHRLPAALAAVALAAAAALRRRWPLAVVLVALAAVIAQQAVGGRLTENAVGALPAVIMCFYGAGAFLAEERAWLALGLGLLGVGAGVLSTAGRFSDLLFTTIFLLVLPWAIGRLLRERTARERAHRESAERLDAERDRRAVGAAFSERTRIARELHDVIAHSVSVMVIQAAGARTVMISEPERAEASLRSVERAGRDALAEMRRLLGVLGGGEDPRALAPQPGLANLEALISRACAAGVRTELLVEGDAAELSPALDLCVYRIVQEALTNAIKHAGPARAAVRLRWTHDALELEVSDDGRGARRVNGAAPGHGIAGMRERAALHGGSLQAGAGATGGFAVRANLRLSGEPVL
jgi:signal transduction histidine kinase